MLRSGLTNTTNRQNLHHGNVFSSIGYESIGTIAKLGQKEDIYSNIFNQIDRDHNGYLDKDEFRDATKALNLSLSEGELTQIYNTISDKNGVITLNGFTKFIKKSVSVHKQFMKLQQEFKSSINNKLMIAKSSTSNTPKIGSPQIMISPREGDPLIDIEEDEDNHHFEDSNDDQEMNGISDNLCIDSLIEDPIYQITFNYLKLNKLQKSKHNKYGLQLPLITDKNHKNCFIGHCRIIHDKKKDDKQNQNNNDDDNDTNNQNKSKYNEYTKMPIISSDETGNGSSSSSTSDVNNDTDNKTDNILIESEKSEILNLIPHSQIISVNNINCDNIGYRAIINILDNTSLPHNILFRKTIGIAIEKKKKGNNGYDDESEYDDFSQYTASIHDSEKYVVHDRSEFDLNDTLHEHCKYCPDKSKHSILWILHRTVEDESYSKLSFVIITYIMICIILSTIAYVIETVPAIQKSETAVRVFLMIEFVVSISFTVEYVLRIISVKNRWKYFIDVMNLIDFLAVIPFWIEILSGSAGAQFLRVIRIVRLARVIRLMKSDRFVEYLNVFINTIKRSSESFGLLSTLIALQVILFGSLFYVIEAGTNPYFNSIPMGAFYTVVTITTVGYGDMIPITLLGRIVAIICMFLGLLIVALPVIIIGGNFEKEYRSYMNEKVKQKIYDRAEKVENIDMNQVRLSKRERGFCEVWEFLRKVNAKCERDIFDPQDAQLMCSQGLDSGDKLRDLLNNDRGYAFYPSEIQKSKVFVLHELYGSHYRSLKIKNELKRQKNSNRNIEPKTIPLNDENRYGHDMYY